MSDKRSLDDILQQALPEQSKELYLKRWMEFLTFRSNNTKDYTIETVLKKYKFLLIFLIYILFLISYK